MDPRRLRRTPGGPSQPHIITLSKKSCHRGKGTCGPTILETSCSQGESVPVCLSGGLFSRVPRRRGDGRKQEREQGREAQSWNFTIIKLEIISIIWSHNSSPFCGVMAPLENLMKVMELSSEKCARTQFQSIHGNPESHHSIPGKPLDFLLWTQAPGNQAYFMAPDSEGLLPRLAGGHSLHPGPGRNQP